MKQTKPSVWSDVFRHFGTLPITLLSSPINFIRYIYRSSTRAHFSPPFIFLPHTNEAYALRLQNLNSKSTLHISV
ncbi:Putative protein [Zobellia galactanivorans]|uniref:Uncharacterized protein n=1 Tax=Zobellia galactanivorans (strain DSM 12802 / CCUG 47099 / CIP 106680 / NCIMB 13871 / Dsij) TaxID=63186 RepID=G0LC16_ZOBGA|nr:Putative protein [Zobellia galactanivorans]